MLLNLISKSSRLSELLLAFLVLFLWRSSLPERVQALKDFWDSVKDLGVFCEILDRGARLQKKHDDMSNRS